jgi:predicted small lipoprotein YifL
MRSLCLAALLALAACGPQGPFPLVFEPDAVVPPPTITLTPPPGPFNGSVTVTVAADQKATLFWTSEKVDPRSTTRGRQEAPAPATITLDRTTTLTLFASNDGKDSELVSGTWVRAGGPVGTITGTVIFGGFCAGKEIGIARNGQIRRLGKAPMMAGAIPFSFTGLMTGTQRLVAYCDRNADDNLMPFIDFSGDTVAITLDLTDPFKASAEDVKVYVGASGTGLGTLRGTIILPKPPPLQNLSLSVLSPDALSGGLDPQNLLQQLQNGYRIFTTPDQTEYPYVVTDLMPGRILPVPSLLGFGNGGFAINLLANPLRTVQIEADKETVQDFAFGPVTLGGDVTIRAMNAPTGGFAFGIVAARITSLQDGIQAVLMPVLFTRDPMTNDARASYSGAALKANQSVALRVFSNANGANPITDALAWVVNPFNSTPPHATVQIGTTDTTRDIIVP